MLPASELSEARPWRPGARGRPRLLQGESGAWSATSWVRGVWAAWSEARMFCTVIIIITIIIMIITCTVLMAEVVGEVEASRSRGLQ